MKKVLFTITIFALCSVVFAQKMPKAGAFNKFVKSNHGVSLYFHYPNDAVIPEDEIASWDWENYTITLSTKGYKKISKLQFPEFDKNAKKPAKTAYAFSICFNDKVITPVLAVKDTVPFDIEFPYIQIQNRKKNKKELVIAPSNGDFEQKMKECEQRQNALLELGKSDPFERLVVMNVFRNNGQLCKDILIPHMMLYDRDLYLYLEAKNKLIVTEDDDEAMDNSEEDAEATESEEEAEEADDDKEESEENNPTEEEKSNSKEDTSPPKEEKPVKKKSKGSKLGRGR